MKPYYEQDGIVLYHGDCRDIFPSIEPVDCVIADPPYNETTLGWDKAVEGWLDLVPLKPSGSMWCFGSLRSFLRVADDLAAWTVAQDVIWEKHNGSNAQADRFRRVHEQILHLYRGPWADVYKKVQTTPDSVKRAVRRKQKPPQWSRIESSFYRSEDGGPRMMRSVLQVRSCHGTALHPTQKPLQIIAPLIEYSSPPGSMVLEPFAGAGSALVVAKSLGRPGVGDHGSERSPL